MTGQRRRQFLTYAGTTAVTAGLFAVTGTHGKEGPRDADGGARTRDEETDARPDGGTDESDVERLPESDAAADWAAYRAGSGHTARVRDEPALSGDSIGVAWEYEYGGEPVVSDGTVYLWARTEDGQAIHAIDAAAGTLEWAVDGLGDLSTPTVAYDTVYVGGDSLTALDAADGSVRWRREFESAVPAPTVAYERVYVADDDPEGGRVVAFDAADGTVTWEREGPLEKSPAHDDGTFEYPLEAIPLPVSNGAVYAGAGDFAVAFDAVTGAERWAESKREPVTGLLGTDDVVVSTGENPVAIDAETGEGQFLWYDGPRVNALDDEYAYGCDDHRVYAHDVSSGDRVWNTERHPFGVGDPVVTEETVFVSFGFFEDPDLGHRSGSIVAFDRETGREEWTYSGDGDDGFASVGSFVVSGDTIYATADRRLVALRSGC